MKLSTSEQLTLNFYKWESKGRGYFHSPFPVHIEPPFVPFQHQIIQSEPIDDGRVPTLFRRFMKLIEPQKETEQEIEEEVFGVQEKRQTFLSTFEISYSRKHKIDRNISLAFLNMLSFSESTLSFEFVATGEEITIQISCSQEDTLRVQSLLKAYFPDLLIKEVSSNEFPFNDESEIALCDFGLEEEFMRTIQTQQNFHLDPLTSIFSVLESIEKGDVIVFQILFKGLENPWAKNILNSVSDYQGNSFFVDSPEMLNCAKSKVSHPLFAVVMRVSTQSIYPNKAAYLAKEVIRNISLVSSSEFNRIIPLSNEGYDFNAHMKNLFFRQTNRTGMILNSEELLSFIHYPNENIHSLKLKYLVKKTKQVSKEISKRGYKIGVNEHQNQELDVCLNNEQLVQHSHIIGATGVGKSTLLANLSLEIVNKGLGITLFDPHGDIVEDILLRIPEHRKEDVIVIDPSYTNFPIGFNLLQANSDAEKIVLSSDLVSAFKSHATTWGDNMTAVLSNVINTFLESDKLGTLIELKRFLIEDKFRNEFLTSVQDEALHYYWKYEFPMVKKKIAPLLTRIDTFLRPKIIRNMFAQRSGLDFKSCINENKIILIKLSQGLIGNENSYLLGSLFLSKINQVALGRQSISKQKRNPYFVMMDEFHSFITPSISSILSGARKYSLGLILAHQNLKQIQNSEILESIISNSSIRIAFRLGDNDAKTLESGFSFFEKEDLTNLEVGEAIVRVGKNSNDFNLKTNVLTTDIDEGIKSHIIENTHKNYAQNLFDVEKLLKEQLPSINQIIKKKEPEKVKETIKEDTEGGGVEIIPLNDTDSDVVSEEQKRKLIERNERSVRNREHTYLQTTIKKLGQQYGFLATIEKETVSGGRIDVVLEKENLKIACEISVSNKPEYEVENIKKCLYENYHLVLMISKNEKHLNKIKILTDASLSKKELKQVYFITPKQITEFLNISVEEKPKTEIVRGFRVTTEYENDKDNTSKAFRGIIARILGKNIGK